MIDLIINLRKRLLAIIIMSTFFTLGACNVNTEATGFRQNLNIIEPIPVALLIPKSNEKTAELAQSLENAAKLAVNDLENIKIDLRLYDTAGSTVIAAQAAQTAVEEGAKIILGPLFAEAANAVGLAVAGNGVNVLSFSNNASIAGGNVFLLGQTFENTAQRLIKFAESRGKRNAIIVHPTNIEGEFGKLAIEKAALETELNVASAQGFEFSREGVANAVPLVRAAVEIEDADLVLLTSTTAGALGLLIQMLPEAGVDPNKIQYAGLARWDVPSQNLELMGAQGGWFTVPDQQLFSDFSARFESKFGMKPHHLASLSYDGIAAIGALIASGKSDSFTKRALTQSAGFEGVDGIFRFLENGTNERGLAVAQVVDKQVEIIDPAPKSFGYTGF